ncbi:DNA repair protein RadA [Desulfuribacillus alkaliarsenatis]|uniref:DNA repair protein RadA n=1 Tax=Desulfuribacillus alkaliarsenatis TaxID=766136 RepID=A0A1E5G4F7_9FIRM|nr:DNA repair protein RadA [Desulfuribacillus alkaliarsenatis]OEF97968.1 DNA repair protein RadA [Desulfuribacillus alkaliarsenatis]
MKAKTKFICQECGFESLKWYGKCPGCSQWSTLVEEIDASREKPHKRGRLFNNDVESRKATSITDVKYTQEQRMSTTIQEFDRVLGGGIVIGSLVLLGGDPGIGKSTIILQTAYHLAKSGKKVLYISGEESLSQLKMRAERLNALHENILVIADTNLDDITMQAYKHKPDLLIIDSIQTMYVPEVTSAPGSVSQVREATAKLMHLAKEHQMATIIIGHVTKQGSIAGPKVLEHMVDTVLYIEGDKNHFYRLVRTVKNRFGSTHELGVFEMNEQGLQEVKNPSEIFLPDRDKDVVGATIVASMEGSRPFLIEIQALVSPTSYVSPKRTATGIDYNRVALIMAVLEKKAGLVLQNQDAFINAVGGVRLDDPAVDLGVAVAIASSFRNTGVPHDLVAIGEIGLTGEIRSVTKLEARITEAQKLGFKRMVVPYTSRKLNASGIGLIYVKTVMEALEASLEGRI